MIRSAIRLDDNAFRFQDLFFSSYKFFLTTLCFLILSLASAKSFYIKLGNSLSYSESTRGNITNLDFGFLNIKDFHLGVSLQQGLYSYKGFYNQIEEIENLTKAQSFQEFYKDFYKIESLRSRSNIFFTLMYKPERFKGIYLVGGLGYGLVVNTRESLRNVVDLFNITSEFTDIRDLIEDEEFGEIIQELANNTQDLANYIQEAFPGLEDIIDQLDSPEDIESLLEDEDVLQEFVDDLNNFYDNQGQTQSDVTVDLVCSSFVHCRHGLAYTIGIGYDMQLWGPIGLDIKADIQQVVNTKPAYSVGASIILRPSYYSN